MSVVSGATETAFDRTRIVPFGTKEPAEYSAVHALQERLLAERIAGGTGDLLLVGEHARVVTLGRGLRESVGALPIPTFAVERGGLATWHGPGQLVVYPIVSLADLKLGIREYLRALEEGILLALARFGIEAGRREGATGVWVGERKIASIGVAVRRRVTWHGLALNVRPDLREFALIQPCGFAPTVMTSMDELLRGAAPSLRDVETPLVRELVRVLGLRPPIWEEDPLAPRA